MAKWSTVLENDPDKSRAAMQLWQKTSDLASVRDDQALANLPEAERKDWH